MHDRKRDFDERQDREMGWDREQEQRARMTPSPFFDDYGNVLRLGRHFVSVGYTAEQLQWYYDKPWAYEDEWNEMLEMERA